MHKLTSTCAGVKDDKDASVHGVHRRHLFLIYLSLTAAQDDPSRASQVHLSQDNSQNPPFHCAAKGLVMNGSIHFPNSTCSVHEKGSGVGLSTHES